MESRTESRTSSPNEPGELQQLVFDLVRERLLKAVGAGGMWTLQFRANTDTDSLFGQTISEYIARDISTQIAASVTPVEVAPVEVAAVEVAAVEVAAIEVASVEVAPVELAETQVDDDIQPVLEEEIVVESRRWSDIPVSAEAQAKVVVEQDQHDEHRMFKPRKAA